MSLNTAHTDGGGGVVIHQGEMILLHAPATHVSFSGSDDLKKFTDVTGTSYLTTHRLIFLTKGTKSTLASFSFPFCVLSEVDVEQPVFGANFLKGKVRAQPNGNWRGEAKFKLHFKAGGAIDFAQGMIRAIAIAKQMSSQNEYWSAAPPAYSTATSMPAPPNYYAMPESNVYGWMPPSYNFPPPQPGTVFVTEAPPPYPGMGGGVPQQPQNPSFGQPQNSPYGQPQNSQFGQGPNAPYGQSQNSPYGQNAYGQPQNGPYGQNGFVPAQNGPYGQNGFVPAQNGPYGQNGFVPAQNGPYGQNGFVPAQNSSYGQNGPYAYSAPSGIIQETGSFVAGTNVGFMPATPTAYAAGNTAFIPAQYAGAQAPPYSETEKKKN